MNVMNVLIIVLTILPFLIINVPIEFPKDQIPIFYTNITKYARPSSKVAFDDPSRYMLVRYNFKKVKVFSIEYKTESESLVNNSSNTGKEFWWIFANEVNPYQILTFAVKKDTPEILKRLMKQIPLGTTYGLENILKLLNLVNWDEELISKFESDCRFSKFYFASDKEKPKKIDLLKRFYNFGLEAHIKDLSIKEIFPKKATANDIYLEYSNYFVKFLEDIVTDLFKDQLNTSEFNVWSLAFGANLEKYKISNSKLQKDEQKIIDFIYKIRVKLKEIQLDLVNFFNNSKEQYEYLKNYEEYVNSYDKNIFPLLKNKAFFFFQIIFQEVKDYESIGKLDKFIQEMEYLHESFQYGHKKGIDSRNTFLEFALNLRTKFIMQTIRKLNKNILNFPLLQEKIFQVLKNFNKFLLKLFKSIPSINIKSVKKLLILKIKELVLEFKYSRPSEIYVRSHLVYKINFFKGWDFQIINNEIFQGDSRNIFDKTLTMIELMGGGHFKNVRRKEEKKFIFKLEEKNYIKNINEELLLI